MITPLEGILAIALIFTLCFTCVITVKILSAYSRYKKEIENLPQTADEQKREEPKIYYISDKINRNRKKAKRKKLNVPLKGIVVRPKEFRVVSTFKSDD